MRERSKLRRGAWLRRSGRGRNGHVWGQTPDLAQLNTSAAAPYVAEERALQGSGGYRLETRERANAPGESPLCSIVRRDALRPHDWIASEAEASPPRMWKKN